jgi:hypothetical protein
MERESVITQDAQSHADVRMEWASRITEGTDDRCVERYSTRAHRGHIPNNARHASRWTPLPTMRGGKDDPRPALFRA